MPSRSARRASRSGATCARGWWRATTADALAAGLRALEPLVGGAVDAEFARTGEAIVWLQARPLVAAAVPRPAVTLAERGRWRLDAEHNPDPLSMAQASLVAFAESLAVGARLRVVDRYLYVEQDGPARSRTLIALDQLRRRFDLDIEPDCARALAAADAEGSLDAALAAYGHVYRRYYGEVSPSVSRARRELDRFVRAHLGEPLAAHGALLAGLGGATLARDQLLWELGRGEATLDDYVRRFGDHAPSWDVATATDRERLDRVHALAAELGAAPSSPQARHQDAVALAEAAADRLRQRLDPAAGHEFATLWPTVRAVLPIAEDDDLLFLRAQATVRRALLAIHGSDDVFEVTLDEARARDFSRAATRRAERLAAARRAPPIAFWRRRRRLAHATGAPRAARCRHLGSGAWSRRHRARARRRAADAGGRTQSWSCPPSSPR